MLIKKYTLIISSAFSVIVVIWDYIGNYQLCGGKEWGNCVDNLAGIELLFFPFIGAFIFSLITYFMREEIYRAWFKFARWWIPLSIVLIFILPEYSHDWLFPIEKGAGVFVTSALFVLISAVIIIWKYWRLSRRSRL